MISRGYLTTASLLTALSLAGLAACSPTIPVDSVSVTGEQQLPTGATAQLTAMASIAHGVAHDVTASAAWTSSDPSIGTVDAGLVRGVSPGVVTITATTNGVSGALEVTVTSATLVRIDLGSPVTLPAGVGKSLTATGIYTDASTRDLTTSVTWSSSTPSVATVSNTAGSNGVVTSVGPGTATITATDPATGFTGTTVVTVSSAQLVSLAVTPTRPSVALGTKQQFTATGTYTDSTTQDLTATVTWASSATNVATISTTGSSRGLASATGTGTTIITATEAVSGISASTTLTVTAARLASIAVTPATPSVALGTKQQFTATGTYSDSTTRDLTGTVTWESSSSDVAQVSNAVGSFGLASTTGVGTTTIKATDPASTVSGTATLTVTAARLATIAVTPATPSVPVGLTRQFAATGTYTDGTTHDLTASVTWESSAPTTASISNASASAGLATAVALGTTVIKATDAASGISGSTTLTVTSAQLVSIAVTPADPSIPLGTTTQFTAIGTYTNATTQDVTASVTWASSSGSVASVSNAAATRGLATALGTGTTTISATDPGSGIAGSTTLAVTSARLVSIAVTPTTQSVPSGLTVQYTAIGTYTNASTQVLTTAVTWSSTTPAIASVSNASGSEGVATAGVIGTTTIIARDPATNISGSATLTVTAAQLVSIAVTPASTSVPLGLTRQFTATGTYSNSTTQDLTSTVTWSSSAGAVASISNAGGSNGLATTASVGATTITASDPTTHISGATSFTVTAATLVSIRVTPATPSVPLGLTQQFTATGTYTDSSTQNLTASVTWGSSAPAATISNAAGSNGLATTASVGVTTITASDPTTQISGSTTLTVTAATLVSIAVTPASVSLPPVPAGLTQQFTATGTYTDNSTQNLTASVTWESSATGVATISNVAGSQGVAITVATGSTTIKATAPNTTISGQATLTVTAAQLTSISISPASPTIAPGQARQFSASGSYTDSTTHDITASVTWDSSDKNVATISNASGSNGLATAVATVAAPSSTTITATAPGGTPVGTTTLNVTP